jgi:hypothetical protein
VQQVQQMQHHCQLLLLLQELPSVKLQWIQKTVQQLWT